MLTAGQVIDDRYQVVRLLGEGGMGAVYEAENMRVGRRVAIKILHQGSSSAEAMRRFEQEAQAAASVGSSHIVNVLDLGDLLGSDDRYMVMEYLQGESLSARLSKVGKMQAHEAVSIAMQLLSGLAKVHEAGIVHRDLKPANVFLTPSKNGDFVKILDFGICKVAGTTGATSPETLLGTPAYMAPEQVDSKTVDARADLYAVGIIVYRALAGATPFDGSGNIHAVISKVLLGGATPILEAAPDLPPELAAIVTKAISRKPEDRFPTAAAFHEALAAWLDDARRKDRLLADFLDVPESTRPRGPSAPALPAPKAASAPPTPTPSNEGVSFSVAMGATENKTLPLAPKPPESSPGAAPPDRESAPGSAKAPAATALVTPDRLSWPHPATPTDDPRPPTPRSLRRPLPAAAAAAALFLAGVVAGTLAHPDPPPSGRAPRTVLVPRVPIDTSMRTLAHHAPTERSPGKRTPHRR